MNKGVWIYKIQPSRVEMLAEGPTPEEDRLIGKHFEYLKMLTDKGIVIMAGRTLGTGPSSFGIVVYRADGEESAGQIFEADPAVKAGVFRGEFHAFSIALSGKL